MDRPVRRHRGYPRTLRLGDPNTPASVRARVADSIFAHASKAIEIEDIEVRVSELERAAEAAKQFR